MPMQAFNIFKGCLQTDNSYLKAPLNIAARNIPAKPGISFNTVTTKYIIN